VQLDRRVLLIVRTPPPFGGGEMIGAQLERTFAGRYDILAFRRSRHSKAAQGRLTGENVAFGLYYIALSCWRLVTRRPRVAYVDIPKDTASFLRTSVVLLVALALRVRVVGDLAGADFPFLADGSPTARYARSILRRLYRIRVLGGSIATTLRERGLDNTIVLSNGIAPPPRPSVERAFPAPETRFLYVGKISESKGVFTLVAAMAAIADAEPGWRLDVVGDWESAATRRRVLDMASVAGVEDRVVFHGQLIDDDKWTAFHRAHVLLHPTHWDGQPVTILEAFACGLPVVATPVGAIPDTIRHEVDGYLMDEPSAEALLAGVKYVLSDPETYARIGTAAREAYETWFSDATFEREIATLFEDAAR
jgi:glycosyltransferase involved in cell wall biosynthesis